MHHSALEEQFVTSFDQKIYAQARLNVLFAAAVLGELALMTFLLPFFIQSALLAFMLAVFMLTIFGYLMLRQYLHAQQLTYFEDLVKNLIAGVKEEQGESKQQPEQLVEVAKLCGRLADRLNQREYGYYPLSKKLKILRPWNELVSCWLHWRDVHDMRALLLESAVEQHLHIVRSQPTNPDAHALLANAYVMLLSLYRPPKGAFEDDERWQPREKRGKAMQARFKEVAQKAVEEFKILKEYAPNDPWIYTQLAYSYRDLQMAQEEKEAYEAILSLRPQDHDTRFKLGTLYFQDGENARGLKIYEELKKAQFSKAQELLSIYGRAQS